jgi:hypothetical protein
MPAIDLWGIILFLVGAWGSYTVVRMMHLFGASKGGGMGGSMKGLAA